MTVDGTFFSISLLRIKVSLFITSVSLPNCTIYLNQKECSQSKMTKTMFGGKVNSFKFNIGILILFLQRKWVEKSQLLIKDSLFSLKISNVCMTVLHYKHRSMWAPSCSTGGVAVEGVAQVRHCLAPLQFLHYAEQTSGFSFTPTFFLNAIQST